MVVQLAGDATARGHEVLIASAGGSWVGSAVAAGARHEEIPLISRSPKATAVAAARLRRIIKDFGPQVVHTHNVGVTTAAALAAKTAQVPMLTTLHGLAHDDYTAAARLLRWTTDLVVACAPAVGRQLLGHGYPTRRLTTITNGARLEPADADRQDRMRRRLGLTDAPLVVGLGRLVPQKAWHTLVDASAALPGGVQMVVAGDGPLRGELERRAASAGGRVRFVGAVDDVAALLALSTCLVSTSEWEGLPLSLLEALSLGVPAAVTSVDGVRDVIPDDAVVGIPPGDPGSTAVALRRILGDAALRTSLRDRALAAADAWTPERMLEQYEELYQASQLRVPLTAAVRDRARGADRHRR